MPRLTVPARFHQRFELERYVASGQCGDVYQARYKDGSRVALKLFDKEHDKTVFGYFTNEQLLLRLVKEHRQHPHLAEYVESNLVRPPYFVATRFVEGARELQSLLGRPLPPGFVAQVVAQTASALDYLHTGHPEYSPIIHRDVKPNNLLTDAAGNVVLIDLSIARHPGYAIDDEPGLGTVPYMAPEQYLGGEGPATDQFALAVVALQMLTGKALLPNHVKKAQHKLETLRATHYAEVRTLLGARKHTAEVMQQALAFEMTERFASCGVFAARLTEALAAGGLVLNATPPAAPRSRSLLGYAAMATVGVAASAALGIALLNAPQAQRPALGSSHTPLVTAASLRPEPVAEYPSFQPIELGGSVAVAPTTALINTPGKATKLVPASSAARLLHATTAEPAQAPGAARVIAKQSEPLRAAPSTDARILLRLPGGAEATRTGREKAQRAFTWYEVTYQGQVGWCRSTYCQTPAGVR